ncbi:hypothetical protein P9112_009469 [Eukaryota sp. TZLM1-RC]
MQRLSYYFSTSKGTCSYGAMEAQPSLGHSNQYRSHYQSLASFWQRHSTTLTPTQKVKYERVDQGREKKKPLLRSLDINESVRDSEYGKRRADVVVPSFDDVMNVVDVVTVDVCKKNALKNAQSEVSPLDDSELYKRKKYANPVKELKHVRHVDYQICPFAISLYGRLGNTAMNFIDDFENLVKRKMNKRFDRCLWLNRIVFTIFKSIPKMISKALMSVSAHCEEIAVVRFDGVEACFEDIDF